ncbi:hypothetical protein E2C01_031753 [Portunus trituberculatus]|uniref:Uncharacterized protein n=1 Tax=Portunus trituberculatus TaxID=210409 RepID=A0A5B7EYI0_PORTR|nr:hypothetical protein [Portunus trituberculatus]
MKPKKRKTIVNDPQIHQDSPLPRKIRLSQQVIVSGFEAGNRILPALSDPVDPDPVLGSRPALPASPVSKPASNIRG